MKGKEFVERSATVREWLWDRDRNFYWTFDKIRDKYLYNDNKDVNEFDVKLLEKYENQILNAAGAPTVVKETVVIDNDLTALAATGIALHVVGAGVRIARRIFNLH